MRPSRFSTGLVLLGGLWVMATALSAASLERAAELREAGRLEDAKAELESLLAGGAVGGEAAGALDLLAAVAIDAGDHVAARDLLLRLVEEHPESAEAADAVTKLKLLEALLGPAGEAEPASPPAPGAAPPPGSPVPPAQSPAQPPVPASPGSGPATSAAKPAAPEAAPAAPPASAPPSPSAAAAGSTAPPPATGTAPTAPVSPDPAPADAPPTSLVLLAGRGNPYDAALDAVARLTELLRGRGVEVENATGGIAVVEDSRFVQGQLLEAARQRRASSLVFLTLSTARQEVMLVECYEPGGALLWKERVTGGTGWTGRPYSTSGLNENLFQRLTRKLERRVGKPGLPVGG